MISLLHCLFFPVITPVPTATSATVTTTKKPKGQYINLHVTCEKCLILQFDIDRSDVNVGAKS